MFSAETIDGYLHQLGGRRFRAECNAVPPHRLAHAYLNQQRPKVISADSSGDRTDSEVIEDGSIIVNAPNIKTKCPVGTAVSTPSVGGELSSHYDRIIHTVPPFYNYPPSMTEDLKQLLEIECNDDVEDVHQLSKELLRSCYRQSFQEAFGTKHEAGIGQSFSLFNIASYLGLNTFRNNQQSMQHGQRVALPLLGAGCRDFPKDVALEVAALESASWLLSDSKEVEYRKDIDPSDEEELVIAFGLLENADAEALVKSIEESIQLKVNATE